MTKYILFYLFFINFLAAQNQGKAIYNIRYDINIDSLFKDTKGEKKSKFKKTFLKTINITEKQKFSLVFKNNLSHFTIIERMDLDGDEIESEFVKKLYPDHYFDYPKNNLFVVEKGFNKNGYLVNIENNFKISNVTLKDNTFNRNINGYNCSLALVDFGDNEITKIWYSSTINNPFGPLIYNGFPGLVFKVEMPNGIDINLEKIEFKKQNDISIPDNLEEITEERFNEIVEQSLGRYNNN